MKQLIIFLTVLCHQLQAFGAVQRTLQSSPEEFQKYLTANEKVSFAEAYLQLSEKMDSEPAELENCLEEVYLGNSSSETCSTAIRELTRRPLNSSRRELLSALLSKLEKSKTSQSNFYRDLKAGLFETHLELKSASAATNKERTKQAGTKSEVKAWRKALSRHISLREALFLINGKRVSFNDHWEPPTGVYQWSLITNTHEPVIQLGTFSQFADSAIQALQPLAAVTCEELKNFEIQNFGLLEVEVFSNSECVTASASASKMGPTDHLTSKSKFQIEKSGIRHWMWPALALVGLGLASGLKGKQITVQWPGSH